MKKNSFLILILLLCPIYLTGCWDRREINDVAFVVGSALDKEEEKYRVSVQIPLPSQLGGAGSKGGGGGTSGTKSYIIQSAVKDNLGGALEDEQQANSRILNFSHRRVILVGEELAREGLEPIVDLGARVPQNRISSFVVIAEGRANEILHTDAPVEQTSSEMIRELTINAMKRPRSLKDVVNAMITPGIDVALPVVSAIKADPKAKEDKQSLIKVTGLAVFKDNKLVEIFDTEQAQPLLLAMNESKTPRLSLTPPTGDKKITVHFTQSTVKWESDVEDDDVTINIHIQAKGSVIENESTYDLSVDKNINELEAIAHDKIEQSLIESIQKLQKIGADPIGFGKILHTQRPNDWERLSARWHAVYPNVKVNIYPDIHIEHLGALTSPFGRKGGDITK